MVGQSRRAESAASRARCPGGKSQYTGEGRKGREKDGLGFAHLGRDAPAPVVAVAVEVE